MALSPFVRSLVMVAGAGVTLLCFGALARMAAGFAPTMLDARHLAIIIHVATVVPAVPLGAWLLLARKGTPSHKSLGKVWVGLMVTTALAALFTRGGTEFSWIHIFVPITLVGAWRAIATARAGKIDEHRKQIVGMFFGALLIPGVFAFLPGRIMGIWLYG
ncbi:MAG: DUF2306 domain-containing protein [Sphingomonadaceae bacterium]|nr:DUF2306 domain-containing protein [Sphingomonadaceae bacterium]